MKLPAFSDFLRSVNMDEFNYDISRFASAELKQSSDLFTQEQYSFLTQTIATMQFALLAQYHQWLSERLP